MKVPNETVRRNLRGIVSIMVSRQLLTAGGHRRKALPSQGMGQIPRTAGIGLGTPLDNMAYEFNGYGNVKVAGNSARALGLATEHSLSYITGGSAGIPKGRLAATCC